MAHSWGAPGWSWAPLGALRAPLGALGRSWGLPGRAWGSFGPPWELLFGAFWASVEGSLAKSRKPRKSTTVQHFLLFFEVPGPPESLQNRLEVAPKLVWASLGASGGLVGLSEASLGPSVGRLRGSWAVPGWLQTSRNLPGLAQITSGRVQKLSSRQGMN